MKCPHHFNFTVCVFSLKSGGFHTARWCFQFWLSLPCWLCDLCMIPITRSLLTACDKSDLDHGAWNEYMPTVLTEIRRDGLTTHKSRFLLTNIQLITQSKRAVERRLFVRFVRGKDTPNTMTSILFEPKMTKWLRPKAEGPEFESRLRRVFFLGRVIPVT